MKVTLGSQGIEIDLQEVCDFSIPTVISVSNAKVDKAERLDDWLIFIPAKCKIRDNSLADLERSWEDLDYVNQCGYQAFGIDYFKSNDNIEFIRFQSDYNTFWGTHNLACNIDNQFIDNWESIFWPTAYDSFCLDLRSTVKRSVMRLQYMQAGEKNWNIYSCLYTENGIFVYSVRDAKQITLIKAVMDKYLTDEQIEKFDSAIGKDKAEKHNVRDKWTLISGTQKEDKEKPKVEDVKKCSFCGKPLNSNGVCTNVLCSQGDAKGKVFDAHGKYLGEVDEHHREATLAQKDKEAGLGNFGVKRDK